MKKTFVLLTLFLSNFAFALEPTDGIKIDGKEYKNIETMGKTINENWKDFPSNSYSILNQKVLSLSKDIDVNSINKNTEVQKYINYSTALSSLDKISQLQAQIDQKNQAIEDAKKARDEKLANISLKAIYLVRMSNVPSKSSVPELRSSAEIAITKEAVEKLNGMFIESLTVGSGAKFKEQITAKITGSMRVDKVLMDIFTRNNGLFFYLAKVSVSPLQGKYTQNVNQKGTNNANITVEYISNPAIQNANTIPQNALTSLNQAINQYNQSVTDENEVQLQTQQQIMSDFSKSYKKLSNEIENLQDEISETTSSINELYKKIGYTSQNPNIKDAKKHLTAKIETLENERISIKNGELFIKKSIQSTESSDVSKDVAKMVSDLVNQMVLSYQKIDNFKALTTTLNGEIANDTKQQNQTLYRAIDTFWVYTIPTDGNGFEVVVVAKFKISDTLALPKRICINDKCAFENSEGKLAFGKWYKRALDFDKNGLASVELNGKNGFINTKGEMVIPAKYDIAGSFAENGLAIVKLNGKWGFINTKGEIVIPAKYDDANDFAENGLAAVELNGKLGYVNEKGEMVLTTKFNYNFDYDMSFNNGMAPVEHNGKWGFINTKGKMAIPAKFEDVEYFADGLAAVQLNGKWGFINAKGEMVIPAKLCARMVVGTYSGFTNGLSIACVNENWGFINTKGEMVIPAKYDGAWDFNKNGLAQVQLNGKYGFINTKGEMVIPAKYDGARDFEENGLAQVQLNGKYGFINTKGEMVIPTKYEDADWNYFGNGLASVKLNGKWMLINTKGDEYNSQVYQALKNGTIDELIANFK